MHVTRPENKLLKALLHLFMIGACMIKHASECPCQYRHLETWRPHTHGTNDTKPRMLPHTASPPFSANRQPSLTHIDTPPSLPHSPKLRELVKYARRQDADRGVAQTELPGHETRRQSALTLSTSTCPLCPSACTCMCPMHMRHAHARVHRGSLSLDMCAPCMRVRMCMCR